MIRPLLKIKMQTAVRQAAPADYSLIADLITAAFADEPLSAHDEAQLVSRLRAGAAYIPKLDLCAVTPDGSIVGMVMLTRLTVELGDARLLALAPLAVRPDVQKRGIGSALVKYGLKQARELCFAAVAVLGSPDYYGRFGFVPADKYAISFPFEAPAECCQLLELTPDALKSCNGSLIYPPEFMG